MSPENRTCIGAATGSICGTEPRWAVYDGPSDTKPDRWACNRHLHNAMHPNRINFVLPAHLVP